MGSGNSGLYKGTYGEREHLASGDASFMDRSDNFVKFIAKRRDVDSGGYFDIIAHGTPSEIEITNNGVKTAIAWRNAARLIRNLPGYHGQNIRLLSCSTGSQPNGFAQNLANKLGVNVKAPNDILWANAQGRYFVAARGKGENADLSRRGKFIIYKPGGNQK